MKFRWPFVIVVFLVCVALTYLPALSGNVPFPRDLVLRHAVWDSIRSQAPQRGPELADLYALIYPFHTFSARVEHAGKLPLWNPYILSGAPFQAAPDSGIFYPLNWTYLFLSMPWAWTLTLAIRMFLAATFMALLIRALGGSLAGCVVAGVVFACCGFITVWQGHIIGDSAIWLPMVCYSVYRLHRTHSFASVALAAVSFAMPVLAGHPETAAHLTLVGCVFALVLGGRRFLSMFALAGVLGIGLAAVQIVPTVQWLTELKQNLEAPEPALNRHDGQGFFSRDILTSPSSALVPVPEGASYAGVLSLLLAPFAVLHRPRRFVWFFVVITLSAMAIAFSVQPIHWIVEHLPLIKAWKNGRLILVADFGIAALAGLGVTVLENEVRSRVAFTLLVLATVVALAGIYEVHRATQTTPPFLRGSMGSVVFLAASVVLILLRGSGRLNASRFQSLVCGIAALEMITFSYSFLGFSKVDEIYPSAPLFDFLKTQGPPGAFRVAKLGYPIPANSGMIYGFEMAEGYDLTTERVRLFTDGLRDDRDDGIFFRADGIVNTIDRRFDLLNVKYIAASFPGPEFDLLSSKPGRFRVVYKEPTVAVFENRTVLPRAFVVPASGVQAIAEPARQLTRVKDETFDPLHNVVLPRQLDAGGDSGVLSTSQIDILPSDVNGTNIRTHTSGPSVLVLSQFSYPGWRATIDGRDTPVLVADFALPAVELPAGRHQVEIRFVPVAFKMGAVISIFCLALLALAFLTSQLRRQYRR
jgi:hypothetical protein